MPVYLYDLHVYVVCMEAKRSRVADDCELPWGYLEPNPVFLRTAIGLNC